MAGKHRADPFSGRRRSSVVAVATVLLLGGGGGAALAHNHAANPSGVCNQSGMGTSPGNSGETNLNPAGKPVGKANAGATRSNCVKLP